jgi:hypothetical protein
LILLDKPGASDVIALTLPELNCMETQLCELLHWDIGLSSDTFWDAIGALAKAAEEIRDTSNADPNDTMPAALASSTTRDARDLPWGDKQCLVQDTSLTSQHTTSPARRQGMMQRTTGVAAC